MDAECNVNLDSDISGDGVRASIWVQIGVMIFISAVGRWHREDTGIKEVTGGLILTHASLVIALIVQMRRGTLTSVDAAIGAAILDAQNVALQIPLTAKETLAARWQVLLVIPTRILGLIVLPFLVAGLERGDFVSEGCECLHVFFWSWISHCGNGLSDDEGLACFYVYYSLRWIMVLRSSCEALHKTGRYHRAEKGVRTKVPLSKKEADKLSRKAYKKSPATISFSHMLYALYAITSMVAAETMIQDFELRASSSVYSVGQIIAIIIAGSTVFRALWIFIGTWNKADAKGFPDLVFTLLRGGYSYLEISEAGSKEKEAREREAREREAREREAREREAREREAREREAREREAREREAEAAEAETGGAETDESEIHGSEGKGSEAEGSEAEELEAEDDGSQSDFAEGGEPLPASGPSSLPSAPSRGLPTPTITTPATPAQRRIQYLTGTRPRPQSYSGPSGASAPSQLWLHGTFTYEGSALAWRPRPRRPYGEDVWEISGHMPIAFHESPRNTTRPHPDTTSYRYKFRHATTSYSFKYRNPFRNPFLKPDSDDDDSLSDDTNEV